MFICWANQSIQWDEKYLYLAMTWNLESTQRQRYNGTNHNNSDKISPNSCVLEHISVILTPYYLNGGGIFDLKILCKVPRMQSECGSVWFWIEVYVSRTRTFKQHIKLNFAIPFPFIHIVICGMLTLHFFALFYIHSNTCLCTSAAYW